MIKFIFYTKKWGFKEVDEDTNDPDSMTMKYSLNRQNVNRDFVF